MSSPSLSPGRLLYLYYHRPRSWLRDLARDGGPRQRRLTRQGEAEMAAAAATLPPLSPRADGAPLRLHLLTGKRFWHQTAFCLWSFARHTDRELAPVIYDDGSLAAEHRDPLLRLFPATRIVGREEILERLDALLPADRFPRLRDRWLHYPNIRKLIDPHLGQTGWKLVLDSDLLFFRRPDFLLSWLEAPETPLHAVDCETSYGYPAPLLESLAGAPLAELVNVGLCGLRSDALDWERLEFWCRELITRHGPHYYLEQALVAALVAGKPCAVAPARDYVTLPRPPEILERRAVMHHYVAGSKRWYFQHNWRAVLR